MRFHDEIWSEEDFDQLPPALQRKYFSSLERLRLAHDASSSNSRLRQRSRFHNRPSTAQTGTLRKPSVSSSGSTHRRLSVSSNLSRERTRSRSYLRKHAHCPISPSTSLINPWDFAALPRAVQRKQFSPEEQVYIAGRLNLLVLDATDEALYKHYQQHTFTPDVASLYHSHSHKDIFTEEEEEEYYDEDMEARDLESLKCLDDETNLDLRLDDYHAISTDLSRSSVTSPLRRSFRRGLSFSNISFRRRSSSSISLQSPPQTASAKTLPSGPSPLFLRHQSKDSTTSIDPSATHYQDPAAKMKLRVYLASPQKFDEALEFGFPSLHKDAMRDPARPKTSPGLVDGKPKTFFDDDTPSLSEDESRDESHEYIHHDSPRTPIDMSFPTNRPPHKSSYERPVNTRPRYLAMPADPYTHAAAADREMTLRMTLTRPELRALEETKHVEATPVNERPLEKAPLTVPFSNNVTIWDELPEEPSRVKRFLKKLKGH